MFGAVPMLAQLDGSLWEPSILAVLLSAFVSLFAPWLAAKMKARGAKQLQAAEDARLGQAQFYADLQERLKAVEEDYQRCQEVNLELRHKALDHERRMNDLHAKMDAVAEDVEDIHGVLEEHLSDHPAADELARLATQVLDRVRRGREAG